MPDLAADLQTLLDRVAEGAARSCGADDALVWLLEGVTLFAVAHFGGIELLAPTYPRGGGGGIAQLPSSPGIIGAEVLRAMTQVTQVPTLDGLRARREEILRVAAEHGASHVRVFGSVARGEADEKSDIDLLVHMAKNPSGFAYFGRLEDLRRALTMLLGCPVGIMDVAALRRMRARVLAEAVPL